MKNITQTQYDHIKNVLPFQRGKEALINNLSNILFFDGVVPVAMEVVFFDSDGIEFGIADFDSFFVFVVIDRTTYCQSLARRCVADQVHNRCQIM